MLLVPALPPLTFHWYDGEDPPFVGVAVNVTDVPAHTGLAEAAIDILTGESAVTVIVTVFDVAGLPVAHVALDVSIHSITSPLAGV